MSRLIITFLMLCSFDSNAQLFSPKKKHAEKIDWGGRLHVGTVEGNSFYNAGMGMAFHLDMGKIGHAVSPGIDVYYIGAKKLSDGSVKGGLIWGNGVYHQVKGSLMLNLTRDVSIGYVGMIGGGAKRFLDNGYRLSLSKAIIKNPTTGNEMWRIQLNLEHYNGFSWVPNVFDVGFIYRICSAGCGKGEWPGL